MSASNQSDTECRESCSKASSDCSKRSQPSASCPVQGESTCSSSSSCAETNIRSSCTKECDGSEGGDGATVQIQRSCISLPLPDEQLKELVADARDYALLHGAGMRYRESYSVDTLSMAPFFLLPTPFPRRDFNKVYSLQPLINKLMHRVAHDHAFLEACLSNTIKVDDFTRQLWSIYETVRREGVRQPISLALLRCDVMLDTPPCDASPIAVLTPPTFCDAPPFGGAETPPTRCGDPPIRSASGDTPLHGVSGSDRNPSASSSSKELSLDTRESSCTPHPSGTSSCTQSEACTASRLEDFEESIGFTTTGSYGGGLSPVSPVTTSKLKASPSVLCCSSPKQVEVNTIASSFAALSVKLYQVHKYVLNLLGRQDLVANLPPNPALEELCSGMIAAWDLYNRQQAMILFVVEDVSYNICDQRFHEYELLRQRPGLRVVRRTLTQIHEAASLDEEGRLWLRSLEVAVVYFRSGYDPSSYHGPNEWAARLLVERSLAIKCPSVHYHLAGTKKVQQVLAAKEALLPFLSAEEAASVSELFTGLYTLDMGPDGDRSVAMALANPDRFVLKPQREGGGNNIYGEDIRRTLQSIGSTRAREGFILMDRIRAPVQTNYLVRPQKDVVLSSVISELGIFGALLGSPLQIFLNKACGHMLRSKLSTNNEGGVASGNGALDSVLLVD